MRKNKKILYAAAAGCVILAGAVAVAGINPGYPGASEMGNIPSDGETPPSPPDGSGAPPDGIGAPPDGNIAPPDGNGEPPSGGPGTNGGGSDAPSSYTSANTYENDTEVSDKTINSQGSDENAVLVQNGANVTMKNITLERTSSDSTGGDSASFYGIGAAMLVTDGVLDISDSTINTDSAGGAGIFAYKSGVANVSGTTIHTKQDTSGGIHVAGGGTLNAYNLDVVTEGNSSAAIRSDRGSGTMNVTGGTYISNGSGSPAVYCTANITVKDAELAANGSEAVCIEGLNSLELSNCSLSGDMPGNSQNDCTWNVILYQSMSGDAETGNSSFTMEGGTLTTKNGGVFYTTNTESTFNISNVKMVYADENDFFLKCTGNSNARGWGAKGSNGADCKFTANKQEMQGDIIWDSISTLDFKMSDGSTLKGAFVQDESNAGNGGNGYANVTIDASSIWVVTGDSTVSSLDCSGTIQDADGNTVTIMKADGTVISKGSSKYKITVTSASLTENTQNITGSQDKDASGNESDKNVIKEVTRTIKAGKTFKIKAGKGAKVSKVSDRKIVNVKIKGNFAVIKGKKAGTAAITIKNKNTTYKINVKVK